MHIEGLRYKFKFEGYRISRTGFLDVYLDSVSGIESSDLAAIVYFAEKTDPQAVGIYVYVPHNSEYDKPQASLIYDSRSRIWKTKPTKLYHKEYTPIKIIENGVKLTCVKPSEGWLISESNVGVHPKMTETYIDKTKLKKEIT